MRRWVTTVTVAAASAVTLGASFAGAAPIRIACTGDSITYGAGVEARDENNYPAFLGYLLGPGYEVRNFGVSGATLLRKGNYPYWGMGAYTDALAFRPDIAVVMLGTNDTKAINWTHKDEYVGDYKDLIASIRAGNESVRVLVCLPPPCFMGGEEIDGARLRDELLPLIRQVAFESGTGILDLWTPLLHQPELFPDKVHPNAFGAEFMARRIYETLAYPADPGYDAATGLAEFSPTVSDFYGYRQLGFTHNGRSCIIVQPMVAAQGHPWVWRARFFGWEPQSDIVLLEHGFHVAYCDVAEIFGEPAVQIWEPFYALSQRIGLAPKPVMKGVSRGGLLVYTWAAAHPEAVSCIFGYAPVLDARSWPGGKGKGPGSPADWQLILRDYGLTDETAAGYKGFPIDTLAPLAQAGIPIIHYVGDADETVPAEENSDIVEARYRALGGSIEVIKVHGMGHHPPQYNVDDATPVTDFILRALGRKANFAAVAAPSTEFRGEAAGWGGGTWWDQHRGICKLAKGQGGNAQVVFLGDSITQGWTGPVERVAVPGGVRPFDRLFGEWHALGMGISGDRTEHVLFRIRNGDLDGVDPKVIVLMVGVNNLWGHRNSGEEIARGTEAIVRTLHEMRPNARLLLLGCFPTSASPDSWERRQVNALHDLLAPMADGERITYLDLRSLFLNPDGSPNHEVMSTDDVHLAGPGYEAWGAAIVPVLRRLAGG